MDIMEALLESKYFVRLGGRHLHGNQIIEAAACRCLVVGNPAEFSNDVLFTPRTSVSRFDGLLERLEFFENHPSAYAEECDKQAKLLDYFGYYKPMTNLLRFLKPRCVRSAAGCTMPPPMIDSQNPVSAQRGNHRDRDH